MAKFFYRYGAPIYKDTQKRYRRGRRTIGLIALILLVVIGIIIYDLWHANRINQGTVSRATVKHIGDEQLYRTKYFEFTDNTDKWKLGSNTKEDSVYYFLRYHNGVPEHSVTVYVNQTPTALYLAVPQVLPVTIINGDSFQAENVSPPCGQTYKTGEPHIVREVKLAQTDLLCDPDIAQYEVVFGQIGGDYRLNLHRQNGSTAQYIIIYKNLTATPQPNTLNHIARTFKAI